MSKKIKLRKGYCEEDDLVHYTPVASEFDPFETYCGRCDTKGGFRQYKETTKKVTCGVCLHTAKIFKDGCIL